VARGDNGAATGWQRGGIGGLSGHRHHKKTSPQHKLLRIYAKEYQTYHSSKPEQIKRRDAKNKARAIMVKKGLVRKGDGMHIDRRNNDPLVINRSSNFRAATQKRNLRKKKE
jgi:hypothetical protein